MTDERRQAGPKIAIIGSCVTRDAFADGGEVAYYSARASLAARAQPPVAFSWRRPPQGLNNFELRCVEEDFAKTWLERLPADADLIVIDLVDERNAIAVTEGSCFTASMPYEQAAPFLSHEPVIERLADGSEYFRRWEAGVGRFARAVRGRCGAARIAVHRALWSPRYRSRAGAVERFGGEAAAQLVWHNARLERLYAMLADALGGDFTVLEPDAEPLACEASAWGLTPFHYTAEYHQKLRLAILASAGLSAP
jgi:hypothetical protein